MTGYNNHRLASVSAHASGIGGLLPSGWTCWQKILTWSSESSERAQLMHHSKTFRVLAVSLLYIAMQFAVPVSSARAEAKLEIAELGDCALESGELIHNCRLGYRRYGKLAADASNIVIMPAWHNGTSEALATYNYLGPNGIVDTNEFHVIAVDPFGNGVASSPSNSTQRPFPDFTIGDMVRAQHRLLTEQLGLSSVHAIVGASMGGFQVFEWMMQYPDYAANFVPIEGAPWSTYYDYLKRRAVMAALEAPLEDPAAAARATNMLTAVDALLFWTPEYVNREFGNGDFDQQFEKMKRHKGEAKLRDRASQNRASMQHDIRKPYPDFEAHLSKIGSLSVLAVVFSQDHEVNPSPTRELAAMMGFEVLEIAGDCGHFGPNPECYQQEVANSVNQFLSQP